MSGARRCAAEMPVEGSGGPAGTTTTTRFSAFDPQLDTPGS
jgi:hypothetical protein